MKRILSIAVSGALTLVAAAAAAQQNAAPATVPRDAQRYCQEEDLAGHTYKMMEFREVPPRKESAWMREFPFEYIYFGSANSYSSINMRSEAKTPKELESYLAPRAGQDFKFTLDKQGVLNLINNNKMLRSYRCVTILQTVGNFRKTDVVVTGYTKKGKSQIYKLYRLWY